MTTRTYLRAAACSAVVALLAPWAGTGVAQAGCIVSDGLAFCSGDLPGGVNVDTKFDAATKASLSRLMLNSNPINNSTGPVVTISNVPPPGYTDFTPKSIDLTMIAEASTSRAPAVYVYTQSSPGSRGSDNFGSGGDGYSGPGLKSVRIEGRGSLRSDGPSTDSSAPVLVVQQIGGPGGRGGTTDVGAGGDGGRGSSSPGQTITLRNGGDWSISSTGPFGNAAVKVVSSGGDGGPGTGGFLNGGRGGDGGTPAAVAMGQEDQGTWRLRTTGPDAHAVSVEVAGGNGGVGGSTSTAAGGNGGRGGNGADINLALASGNLDALTLGARSMGIYASTRGGGGGNGADGGVANGGFAGDGGQGGHIAISRHGGSQGAITTSGESAIGILLLTQGSNGGNGGSAGGFGKGKNGGWGGGGGAIDLNGGLTIVTAGAQAHGMVAQSLGGTGGKGGDGNWVGASPGQGGSTGLSGAITINVDGGAIATQGAASNGILAQSIAGHGSTGGGSSRGIFAFGASGGSAGNGGSITLTNAARITTQGNQSLGFLAQSIGGGGGNGGDFGAFYGQGGNGSIGGHGGTIQINNRGAMTLAGSDATAILAQSIGGTGGNGGMGSGAIALGGRGANASNGGDVSVVNSGNLSTGLHQLGSGATGPADLQICGTGCSNGILAQSIGGGGGNGGTADGWFAVGGNSGGGGIGGVVQVLNSGAIATALGRSSAIVAQSIGGGGGNGGGASSIGPVISTSVGGSGGSGGNGRIVGVTSHGVLTTAGADSHGIMAQSIGGGGGSAGFARTLTLSPGPALAISVGGTGGAGGQGGNVSVSTIGSAGQIGSITTHGDRSQGILAQSVGGGGGSGAYVVSLAAGVSGGSIAFGLGSMGGVGGNGAPVTVVTGGTIATSGAAAHGILAQSVGGGGGQGGLTVSGAINGEASLSAALGGSGVSAGSATDVQVTNGAAITVSGDKSKGILAQSVGGGGGDGGLTIAATASAPDGISLGFSLGGAGGRSGSGGNVTVNNTGQIRSIHQGGSNADNAHGILAQSVGGSGGTGGLAGTFIATGLGKETAVNVAVAVGGAGGASGAGGAVSVSNSAAIQTSGAASSHGIFAQSVGGSGGAGGSGLALVFQFRSTEQATAYNLSMSVGGGGSWGSPGGAVTINNSGAIQTDGTASHGLFASSVGGGGGSGGSVATMAYSFNPEFRPDPSKTSMSLQLGIGGTGGQGNDGGAVNIANTRPVTTAGDGAIGIYGYSIGGGGGDGGDASGITTIPFTDRVKFLRNVNVKVGGAQGASGNGGSVSLTSTNTSITTSGLNASGMYAQSVGGGGGRGGTGTGGFTGTLVVGGQGGAAGNGGDVSVTLAGGSIATGGPQASSSTSVNASYGIFAQSVGGGGGTGGDANMGSVPNPTTGKRWANFGAGLAIGLSGGSAGNGGAVRVSVIGDITTTGTSAVGVFAQSVGGGGGTAGTEAKTILNAGGALGGFIGGTGGAGSGGNVTVDHRAGTITTTGKAAHGIVAQSVGGTGGRTGDVTVHVASSVLASGEGASGIVAQSHGLGGNGTILVDVAQGATVRGNGEAITILDGTKTLVTNRGMIHTTAGIDGTALYATDGDDEVENSGTIVGSVDLGAGDNRFTNLAGAVFRPGPTMNVGAGGQLVNRGLIVVDSVATAKPYRLVGDLVQSGQGTIRLVLDAGRSTGTPVLAVTGRATLGGTITPEIRNAGLLAAGQGQITLIEAEEGIAGGGLRTVSNAVTDYQVNIAGNRALLDYAVDFDGPRQLSALNQNQGGAAKALDKLRRKGELHEDLSLAAQAADLGAYADALDRLSPEPYAANYLGTLFSALRFSNSLMDGAALDADVRTSERDRSTWMRVQASKLNRSSDGSNSRYESTSYEIAAGVEVGLGDGWSLGAGLGYEAPQMSTGNYSDTDGHQVQAGLMVSRELGAWLFAAGVNGGWAGLNVSRTTPDGTKAKGDQDFGFATTRLRTAYRQGFSEWMVEPRMDLAGTMVHQNDFNESGAGAANLAIDQDTETYVTAHPAIELSRRVPVGEGWTFNPRASVGLTQFIAGDDPKATAHFAGASGGSFSSTSDLDRTYVDLGLGFDVAGDSGVELRANGFSQIGTDTVGYGGALNLVVHF